MRLQACALVLLVAGSAHAQVGYLPDKSPYLDVTSSQEWTLLAGEQFSHTDPAGVAPRNGPLLGAEWEWRANGPFHIGVDLATVDSKRLIINAAATDTNLRRLGVETLPLYDADFFIAMGLTGARTWHHIMPMVTLGLGTISDFRGRDTSSFVFGTRFSFILGTGIRWIPSPHFQLRADLTDRLYTIDYPESFFETPSSTTPAFLPASVQKSRWENNAVLTLGFSYFR